MSPVDPNGSWIVVALIIDTETKSCSSMIIFHILLRSILPSVTTTKGKLLVWVRLPYRKINILTRLCLFNLSDITLCLFPSYVIWVCWYCSMLLVVLCFHRMTIHLSSRAILNKIYILLVFPRALLFPHV